MVQQNSGKFINVGKYIQEDSRCKKFKAIKVYENENIFNDTLNFQFYIHLNMYIAWKPLLESRDI